MRSQAHWDFQVQVCLSFTICRHRSSCLLWGASALQTRCAPPPSLTIAGAEALRGGFAALPGVTSPASAARMRRPGVAKPVRSFAGLSCDAPASAKKDCLARSLDILRLLGMRSVRGRSSCAAAAGKVTAPQAESDQRIKPHCCWWHNCCASAEKAGRRCLVLKTAQSVEKVEAVYQFVCAGSPTAGFQGTGTSMQS